MKKIDSEVSDEVKGKQEYKDLEDALKNATKEDLIKKAVSGKGKNLFDAVKNNEKMHAMDK